MKKNSSLESNELQSEYGPELFSQMKANRFTGQDLKFKGRRAVYLDEDVAEVFDTPEAVNTVLRSAIRGATPSTSSRAVRAKPSNR